MNDLNNIAKTLVANYKGILAADESLPTIQKRFDSIQVNNIPENRQAYRELLFSTPGIERYISGVILFDETIRSPLTKVLADKNIIIGIKVDLGKKDLPCLPGEAITQGLDNLPERLREYYQLGARFTKWRAVFTISKTTPTQVTIEANAHLLAMFAAYSQAAGLVPVVEPEVLMDGAHDLARCEDVTRAVLSTVFTTIQDYQLNTAGMLLKPNMILPGKEAGEKADANRVAQSTISVLTRSVPASVPGIVFLSGGQSPQEATANLCVINQLKDNAPWELSFSFGRALQDPVLKSWRGKSSNKENAQKEFLKRAELNFLARQGTYTGETSNL